MKNFLKPGMVLILIVVMAVTLIACGNGEKEKPEESTVVETKTPEATEKAETEEEEATEEPTEKATEEPKKTEKPQETKAPAETPRTTEAPAAAAQEPETQAPVASADTARQYIGGSASSLAAAIGQPNGKSYASSCIGEGEDGEWYYNGFTVYTYRAPDGSERVEDVM